MMGRLLQSFWGQFLCEGLVRMVVYLKCVPSNSWGQSGNRFRYEVTHQRDFFNREPLGDQPKVWNFYTCTVTNLLGTYL